MIINSTSQRKLKQIRVSQLKSPIIIPSSQRISPVASGLNSLKNLHSHKGSSIDMNNLTRLMKPTKLTESVNNLQIQVWLAKAKENIKVTAENKLQLPNKHIKFPSQQFLNFKEVVQTSISPKINKEILYSKNSFNFEFVIGIGGFGKVWKVQHKKTGLIFAMKEMSKALYVIKFIQNCYKEKCIVDLLETSHFKQLIDINQLDIQRFMYFNILCSNLV